MDDTDLEAKWELFLEQQGASIQEEIYSELESSAHLFDSLDGTHAKWSQDGLMGLLLVLDEAEAENILAAFQAGVDGIEGSVCFCYLGYFFNGFDPAMPRPRIGLDPFFNHWVFQ